MKGRPVQMAEIRILVADDHAVTRVGLVSLLETEKGIRVVGQAENGAEAVAAAKRLKPDVIIMDLVMPKMDGAEATAEIKAKSPETKVLLLTSFGSYEGVRRALEAGAEGAILKTAEDETLVPTIRRIFKGEKVISPDIRSQMAENPPLAQLTQRQLEILEGVARGLSNTEIAKLQGVSMPMVRDQLNVIFHKIGAANRTEAVAIALRRHLLKN